MSAVCVVQQTTSVDKACALYLALGFKLSDSNAGAASGEKLLELRHLTLVLKPRPSGDNDCTMLRVTFDKSEFEGSVKKRLIDAGWKLHADGSNKDEIHFVGFDGQIVAVALVTESSSGRHRRHRHHSSASHSLKRSEAASAATTMTTTSTPTPVATTSDDSKKVAGDDVKKATTTTGDEKKHQDESKASNGAVDAKSKKHEHKNEVRSKPLRVGMCSEKGMRDTNEDCELVVPSLTGDKGTALLAVFDGHGGPKAAKYCEKNFVSTLEKCKQFPDDKAGALIAAFIKIDAKFAEKAEDDGTTALVAMITASNELVVAHVGDSRCVVVDANSVQQMTIDHKPQLPAEKERIEKAGHEVTRETIVQHGKRVYTHRIDSNLAVARSIGDCEFKDSFDLPPSEQAVTCVPDVNKRQLKQGDIVVLACDGLYDVMDNEAVATAVRAAVQSNMPLDAAAKQIALKAINELQSDDNVSIVIAVVE